MDMLVNLNRLPAVPVLADVRVVRALPPDRGQILSFVKQHFSDGWMNECSQALSAQPQTCYIAVKKEEIVGFACYDATAKGFFGPIGILENERGQKIGAALLLSCLHAMAYDGYGYAVIGWCDEAREFYRKTALAVEIPDSAPEKSVYGRLAQSVKD